MRAYFDGFLTATDTMLPLFVRYANLWFATDMRSECFHLMVDDGCGWCAKRTRAAARSFDRWRRGGVAASRPDHLHVERAPAAR